MVHVLDQSDNPALGEILRDLRSIDRQDDRHRFRRQLRLAGLLLAYAIAGSLKSRQEAVKTPLGSKPTAILDEQPILATALRAGLPFLDGMLEVFPNADVSFFGAARSEDSGGPDQDGAMKIDLGYEALSNFSGRTLIFADPMVATGSTILDIHRSLAARGILPTRFIVAGLVGYVGTEARLQQEIANIEMWLVTCDQTLDDRGYIVPGLGDAGDLCYGEKA